MDFLLKLNNLLNKSECINKNVYTDINNFIDFKKGIIDNYESVIFGKKYENKYDKIIYFNHGIYLYDSPLYPLYRVANCDVLFNITTDEYIFYIGGGDPTAEKMIGININLITKDWDTMEKYIISFADKIIEEKKEDEYELINELKKYVKNNNIDKSKLIQMIY
jgi:hypothetical protein